MGSEDFFELDGESRIQARNLPGPILILGAGGFVGFNLFQSLRALRPDVFAVVHRLNAGWRLAGAGIPPSQLLLCDLNYEKSVRHLVDTCRPRTVFNLAAYVHAGSSSEYGLNAAGSRSDLNMRWLRELVSKPCLLSQFPPSPPSSERYPVLARRLAHGSGMAELPLCLCDAD